MFNRKTVVMDISKERIDAAKYPIFKAPFFGSQIPVMIRELSHVDCAAIGDFSMINTFHDSIQEKKVTFRKMAEYIELQHAIAEASLVQPTYDDFIEACTARDNYDALKTEMKSIETEIMNMKPGPKRSQLEEEIAMLELRVYFCLPNDFTSFITAYATGVDKTDVKKINDEMLIEAAVLAERGGDNPSDHIGGRFTRWDGDKLFLNDINKRAWYKRYEQLKNKEIANGR